MTEGFKYKLVVAVRKELPLSKGKVAVQVAHAAVSCVLMSKKKKSGYLGPWLKEGGRKIALEIEGLETLKELERVAKGKGLVACIIQDAGLTEIEPGTITCIGIGPAHSAIVDEVTGHLPLL